MKIAVFSVLAFVAAALAVQMPQKSVIVSYSQDTPDRVIDQAMDAIKAAGGYSACSYTPLPSVGDLFGSFGEPLSSPIISGDNHSSLKETVLTLFA